MNPYITRLHADGLLHLAAEPKSQEVTDWASRIGWVAGLVLFIALMYWLMRQGWKWRGTLQGGLPALPKIPEEPGSPARLRMEGRYHGSTAAGQWLERIVAHGLGVRSRAELTLTDEGVSVLRPGAQDFLIPAAQLEGARLDKALAGKVLPEGGLLVLTWEHGGTLIDSGFRSDDAAEHPGWVRAVEDLAARSPRADRTGTSAGHDTKNETEGAR